MLSVADADDPGHPESRSLTVTVVTEFDEGGERSLVRRLLDADMAHHRSGLRKTQHMHRRVAAGETLAPGHAAARSLRDGFGCHGFGLLLRTP